MLSIQTCPLPDKTLLGKYRNSGYTDCYMTDTSMPVTHAQYVNVFYTSFVFKLERLILKWIVSKPSTDAQVNQLADGLSDTFAAWTVEARTADQLLMCDYQNRTRSWLMVVPLETGTRLFFGSAVVLTADSKKGKQAAGFIYYALLWFHKFYSKVLLYSAKVRLDKLYG